MSTVLWVIAAGIWFNALVNFVGELYWRSKLEDY